MPQQHTVTVRITRRFAAAPERVFDAWLDPQKARQFMFAHPGQEMVRAEIDPRVGGAYSFVVRREGKEIDHVGEYLEIDRPRRLVFTLGVPSVWPDKSRITIDIAPLENGCELTLTHEGVLPELEGRVNVGWNKMLDELQAKGL